MKGVGGRRDWLCGGGRTRGGLISLQLSVNTVLGGWLVLRRMSKGLGEVYCLLPVGCSGDWGVGVSEVDVFKIPAHVSPALLTVE